MVELPEVQVLELRETRAAPSRGASREPNICAAREDKPLANQSSSPPRQQITRCALSAEQAFQLVLPRKPMTENLSNLHCTGGNDIPFGLAPFGTERVN